MSYCIIDLETSIQDNIHGPSGCCPENDFYTFIYKMRGQDTKVIHKKNGFKRQIPISLEAVEVIVGHNIKFDLLYFWDCEEFQKFLLRGGYVYDTQLGEYLLTGMRHKMASLAELQLKYLGKKEKPSRISALFKRGIGADKIINKEGIPRLQALYHKYSLLDGDTTEKVFLLQYKKIKKEGLWPIVKMYNKYLLSLTMMEHVGMPFDLDLLQRKTQEYNFKYLAYYEEGLKEVADVWNNELLPEVNFGSLDHLSVLFFGGSIKCRQRVKVGQYKNGKDKFRFEPVDVLVEGFNVPKKLTTKAKKSGMYKCDEAVLKAIAKTDTRANRLAKILLKMRKVKKLASTYFPSYYERQIDGLVHPTFQNTQTITSRLSCVKPNLQNIPKGGEVESLITGGEGWTCVAIDYSQLEVYVLAFLSNCKKLEDQIRNGLDQHCQSLSYAVNKPYEEVVKLVEESEEWKLKRKKIGKGITFSMQYGAGPAKVGEAAGISKDEAQEVINKYYEEYPEIKNFFELVREEIETSSTLCRKIDLSSLEQKLTKNGRRFKDGIELMPIKDWDTNEVLYKEDLERKIGYYRSPTGKKYSYETDGSIGTTGRINTRFSQQQIQNYASQGTAGDVQCASSVSMFMSLLKHKDKIRLINEIHDSKWFLIKDEYVKVLIPKLVEHMEKGCKRVMKEILGINLDINLKVDVEVGRNFGDMTAYE